MKGQPEKSTEKPALKQTEKAKATPPEPTIGFAEYTVSAPYSPALLAGAAYAVRHDGRPRKRTIGDWEQAVQAFAGALAP